MNLKRMSSLLTALLLCACNAKPADAQATTQDANNNYNVLFIAVDDLRPELGCYDVDYVDTPNIDALAESGFVFRQHFVAVPTCGASRHALLTGRSPLSSGVRSGNNSLFRLQDEMQPGAQTLPELFNRSGYRTVLIGKISHTADGYEYAYNGNGDGAHELPHAWDDFATPYGPWERGWGIFFAYANGLHREDGGGHHDLLEFTVEEDNDLPDGLMAERAIEMLGELAEGDEPFFMGLGFFKPHLPFVAPAQDWEAVADWDVPEPVFPDGIDTAYTRGSGEFYRYRMEGGRPLMGEHAMAARRGYLACVRYTDRQVGRVLEALEENGLADNTIVVLWGDHGWMLGEAQMWGKHCPLEAALHSPLIIRAPGVEPGRSTNAVASTVDIYPTLMDLCQPSFTQTHHPLDGVSLLPVMTGRAESASDVSISTWQGATSIRSETHRLVFRGSVDEPTDIELYDLRDENGAWINVINRQPRVARELAEQLPE